MLRQAVRSWGLEGQGQELMQGREVEASPAPTASAEPVAPGSDSKTACYYYMCAGSKRAWGGRGAGGEPKKTAEAQDRHIRPCEGRKGCRGLRALEALALQAMAGAVEGLLCPLSDFSP